MFLIEQTKLIQIAMMTEKKPSTMLIISLKHPRQMLLSAPCHLDNLSAGGYDL